MRSEIVSLPLKVLFKHRRLCMADLMPCYPEQKELCELLIKQIILCDAPYEHFARIAKGFKCIVMDWLP